MLSLGCIEADLWEQISVNTDLQLLFACFDIQKDLRAMLHHKKKSQIQNSCISSQSVRTDFNRKELS